MAPNVLLAILWQCISFLLDFLFAIVDLLKQLRGRRISLSTENILANTALLMANGCPKKYLTLVKDLYKNSNLECPDGDILENLIQATEVYKSVKPVEDKAMEVYNSVKPAEDLHAEVNKSVKPVEDLATEICNSVKTVEDPEVIVDLVSQEEDDHPSIIECSKACEEILTSLHDFEEIDASFDEVQDFLRQFSTTRDIPITEPLATADVITEKSTDDSDLYAYRDIGDWFDEDSYVHNFTAPVNNNEEEPFFPVSPFAASAPVSTAFLNRTVSIQDLAEQFADMAIANIRSYNLDMRKSHLHVLPEENEGGKCIDVANIDLATKFIHTVCGGDISNATFTQVDNSTDVPAAFTSSTPITSLPGVIDTPNITFTLQECTPISKRAHKSTFSVSVSTNSKTRLTKKPGQCGH